MAGFGGEVRCTLCESAGGDEAFVPLRAHAGDAGADLRVTEDVYIRPFSTVNAKTGVALALGRGTAGLVFPRSGLSSKVGVTLANAGGLIDSGYRGEIGLLLHNLTDRMVTIRRGERVAQIVVVPYYSCSFDLVDSLDETERGEGGFGSTGTE